MIPITIPMASSRQVCCCGADCWTKVLAWLEIIGAGIGSVFFIATLISMAIMGKKSVMESLHHVEIPEPYRNFEFGIIIAMMAVLLLLTLCSFVMGIILLKGANERNPNYILVWLTYAATTLAIQILFKMVTLDTSHVVMDLISIALTIVVNGFLFWIVYTFWREVKGDVKSMDSGIGGGGGDGGEYKI